MNDEYLNGQGGDQSDAEEGYAEEGHVFSDIMQFSMAFCFVVEFRGETRYCNPVCKQPIK